MIRAEKTNDNHIRVRVSGDSYNIFAEFFSIANHIAEVCVDTCRPGYLEEFMKEFHKEIDNAFRSAIERNNKGGE